MSLTIMKRKNGMLSLVSPKVSNLVQTTELRPFLATLPCASYVGANKFSHTQKKIKLERKKRMNKTKKETLTEKT